MLEVIPFRMSKRSRFLAIAIDGAAASGKSATARILSERFNLLHADTGAYYRMVTLFLLKAGVSASTPAAVASVLNKVAIGTVVSGRRALLCLNGRTELDTDLRSARINAHVALFAALPPVRTFLLPYQRSQVDIARHNRFTGLVMEGRDIGSVVLPYADFCFFLEADSATRQQRRAKESSAGSRDVILSRDRMDATRKMGPLACAKHAVRIDTGQYSLEQVVLFISKRISGCSNRG